MPAVPVSVVIVPDGWTAELRRTAEHALAQTRPPGELVLVDAGEQEPRIRSAVAALAALPGARVVTGGGSAAARRNAGVRAASGPLVVCLDEGHLLERDFCAEALRRLDEDAVDYVIGAGVMEQGDVPFEPPMPADWSLDVLLGATVAVPVALLFRKTRWQETGGFDEALDSLDVYDFLLRLHVAGGRGVALERPALRVVARREARYRTDLEPERYLGAVRQVIERHRNVFDADPTAVLFGRERVVRELVRQHEGRVNRRDRLLAELRELTHDVGHRRLWLQQQNREAFDWGDLRRASPLSRQWGYDRGTPVDRHYIEKFLEAHASDVRGVVLEVQENDLTARHGVTRVVRSDVVDVNPGNPRATVVADLRRAVTLASDTYDCIILTQTLHVIDDMRLALEECRRILKPGGVLLATLPCASRVCLEYGRDGDFWRVTAAGARALFTRVFPADHVEVSAYGNVFVTAAFLYGLACQELAEEDFDAYDPYFPLLVGVRAVKPIARPPDGRVSRAAPHTEDPPRGAILLYHRVAVAGNDVHGLAVHPDHFEEHVAYLARHCQPMALADLATAVSSRQLPPRAVAVTFDDGYLDNLEVARPILSRHRVPVTFFVPAAVLDSLREFWWDTLARIFFGPHPLPSELPAALAHTDRVLPARTAGERSAAHWALYHRLLGLDVAERASKLDALVAWSRIGPPPSDAPRPMTAAELQALAALPGCTIGAHGVHHLALPGLDPARLRAELVEGRRRLEGVLQRPVDALAYPYGAWTGDVARLARDCGYHLAVTCEEQAVKPGRDLWRLPRLEVRPIWRGDIGRRLRHLLREAVP